MKHTELNVALGVLTASREEVKSWLGNHNFVIFDHHQQQFP